MFGAMLGLSLIITFFQPTPSQAITPCSLNTPAQTICDVQDLDLIHPTQLSVGYRAVKEKAKKLKDMDGDAYRDYLKNNPIPVVIGPNGYYPLDHHHLARAIYENGHSRAVLKIKANWSKDSQLGSSLSAFLNKMTLVGCQAKAAGVSMDKSKPCFYLCGALGQSIDVGEMPRYVWLMRDDPYRSLSGDVRDEGGFTKRETDFYIEFIWALFFRHQLPGADLQSNDGYKKVVKAALKLAHSSAAAHMPGYKP